MPEQKMKKMDAYRYHANIQCVYTHQMGDIPMIGMLPLCFSHRCFLRPNRFSVVALCFLLASFLLPT